jgi:sulfoxide reductase heme-binding subunit YedZ
VRALKTGWKRLQRLAYPAAVLTLLHWVFVHDDRTAALLHFAPLALLEAWRLSRSLRGHRAAPTQPAYNSGESR